MSTAPPERGKFEPKRQMKEYEKNVVASVLFDEKFKRYALDNEIDIRFFLSPVLKKIIKIFNQLANGTVEPNVELISALFDPKTDKEQETLENLFNGLKGAVVEYDTAMMYLQMLKKQFKISRWYQFADDLKDIVENEKINPLSSDFEKMDKEIDYRFSSLLEEYSVDDKVEMSMVEGFEYHHDDMQESLNSEAKGVVKTGYEEIDSVYNGGHMRGTVNLVAARPGMGKTVYMLNEAIEAAKSGEKVVFISIEMTMIQCFQRIVAKIAGISGSKLQEPKKMTSDDWKKLKKAAAEIVEIFDEKFWVIEVAELNVGRLSRIVKDYKKKHDIDTVYLDYIQIMSTNEGKTPDKESDFAAISQGLRIMAKTEDIVVVAGSQLNRDVEKLENKRPTAAHLRNSGTLEQDAARIVGLYRDEVYNPDTDEPNTLEYIILKNRFGERTTIKFKYDLERQDIISMAS